METHPSYPILSTLLAKYPRASSSLFQTYNDIVYAQQWDDVEIIDLQRCLRGVIAGKKRDTQETLYVVPCSLSETLSFAWLQDAFSQLFTDLTKNQAVDSNPPCLYVAITSSDASIVYYKLSHGIVKPPV
ncbi:hypothetical protein CVT25_004607 [Psilocybe cyanescens]|uniref:tRNA-splicing endonuclease subunit Sen15 domain-containing protein n=1 Tax=Psilocybe cyanescens TaxID=93625 RepID=A0A409VS50_PSICY|nr:hypothetical protein CVT25_004607 [Psilocybe cyanescens]